MKTENGTDLSQRMRARADADGLPENHEIRARAAEFDEATKGFFAEPQRCDVRKYLGCWARARRAWSNYSGEALI